MFSVHAGMETCRSGYSSWFRALNLMQNFPEFHNKLYILLFNKGSITGESVSFFRFFFWIFPTKAFYFSYVWLISLHHSLLIPPLTFIPQPQDRERERREREKRIWFMCKIILKILKSNKWKWYATYSVEIHFSFDILWYTASLGSSIEIIRQITT